MDKCYCGKDKKKVAKTCIYCSNYINLLRSKSRYKSEAGIQAKKELEKIMKAIEESFKS